jgi:hypothetical protein
MVLVLFAGCVNIQISSWLEKKGAYKASEWVMHDVNRPNPEIVRPGTASSPKQAGKAPSDAIVLFDGRNLSEWESVKDEGGPAKWKVEKDYMEVVPKTGYIKTRRKFGDCQLHIEWMTLEEDTGKGQKCGNSGVFLMGVYEVQVLNSFRNVTYADGQAGAIYGQSPPLVNASRKPGAWQEYDIVFWAPIFKGNKLVKPAVITVFHNGVLVQDHWVIKGRTHHKTVPTYAPHGEKEPIKLQDHKQVLRFRNIWIREL